MRTDIFFQRAFITGVFAFILLLMGCDRQPIEGKQINVVFRYDDYSARSHTDLELKIIDAFRKNEASVTFGVIPFVSAGDVHDPYPKDVIPLTSEKGDILKTGVNDGILDVALHGYSHQTINAEQYTEFSGLDYNNQVERLAKGKKFLEGIIGAPITTFVPPWNRYDLNTLQALEELGFLTLSAGWNGEAKEQFKFNFLPATCNLTQLRDAVKEARTSSNAEPVVVVLFHSYDFKEIDEKRGGINYQEFYDLLTWLKNQKEVRLLSIRQATQMINDLSANRFLLNKKYKSLSELLPSSLRDTLCYKESRDLLKIFLKLGGFYLAVVSLGALISFMIGMTVLPKSASIMNIVPIGSIITSIVIIVYAFHDWRVYFKGMMASAVVVGGSIGLCICFLYLKKKKSSHNSSEM